MSFYNLICGKNPDTAIILALIGFKEVDIERFRDCWIDFECEEIIIYTRTGGNNRYVYPQKELYKSPYFKTTHNDEYDSTYAYFSFEFPNEIAEDILALRDISENGISANLIRWISKTSDRPPTEGDRIKTTHDYQRSVIEGLQKEGHCSKAFNGHTIVPLSDYGMEYILRAMEAANGELLVYNILPLKLDVRLNVPKWAEDAKKPDIEQEKCRVSISPPNNWPIDSEVWERWRIKFAESYPAAIATIARKIAVKNDK